MDHTAADVPNPGVKPQSASPHGKGGLGKRARYVRVTATKLAVRKDDYIFALAELSVLAPDGVNAARGATVTSLDSIEAPVRWGRKNLVDGYYYGVGTKSRLVEIARLGERRDAILKRSVDPAIRRRRIEIHDAVEAVDAELAAIPVGGTVFAAATNFKAQGNFRPTAGKPRPISVLRRGSVTSPGKPVGPGTVACLPGLPSRFELDETAPEGRRRAALAEWIVDDRNGLTWRSIVNRIWGYHFGRSIVNSPNDFGRMGGRPSHPELLDWLAVEFRASGGSMKHLHRLIVTSAVYRQSSAHRPDAARVDGANAWLWRMNRRRLEAEAIRDAVLMAAGKLDARMGGPGFRAFGFKDDHSPHYKYEQHDPDDAASHRRSIYRFIVRSVPDPFMTTLDCADPSMNVARRNETLTAIQALAMMNNRFMVRMAEHFAARVEAAAADPRARLRTAFRLALGRWPDEDETDALAPIAEKHGLANTCRLLFNTNEFVFVD